MAQPGDISITYVRELPEIKGERNRKGGFFFRGGSNTHWRKPFKRRRRKKHRKTSGDFLRIETSADFLFIYQK